MKIFSRKGFIGPIGDDLPSLIPLVLALVLFFAAFSSAYTVFVEKTDAFSQKIESITLVGKLKRNSYIAGFEDFEKVCNSVKDIRGLKFKAGLMELYTDNPANRYNPNIDDPPNVFGGIDIKDMGFFVNQGQEFMCSNLDASMVNDLPTYSTPNLQIRFFPVALEFNNASTGNFYVKPMLMVVIIWS